MAVELKDVFTLIGFEPPEGDDAEFSIEDIRNTVESRFIPIDEIETRQDVIEPIVSKHIGQRLGQLQTGLIKEAKGLGLELSHSDFKDQKIEEIYPAIFGKIGEKLSNVKKPDGKLNEELERYKNEFTELKTGYEQLQSTLSEKESQFQQERESWEINHVRSEDWKGIKLSPEVDKYKRRGFETEFSEKYALKKFEDGIFPVYAQGERQGSRVKGSNLSKPMTHAELLQKELEEAGMLAKPHEGKQVRKPSNGQQQSSGSPNEGGRKMHPAFAAQRVG